MSMYHSGWSPAATYAAKSTIFINYINVISSAPPQLEAQNLTIEADIGEKVILPCKISTMPKANPSPSYTWTKESGEAFPHANQEPEGRVVVDEGQLRISEVREEDYGSFVCRVENYLGTSVQTVTLERFPTPPPPMLPIKLMVEVADCNDQVHLTISTNLIVQVLEL